MMTRRKYRKKVGLPVAAVQLDLDTDGFTYEKWGGTQTCKAGDWIVDNDGEVYTVDSQTFAATYRRQREADSRASAVQLNFETEGFTYRKEGKDRTCNAGDWIVEDAGNVDTMDSETITRTHPQLRPAMYEKIAPVWAEIAQEAGYVQTKEGVTHYDAGDYIVSNDPEGKDAYAVEAEKFEAMYELASEASEDDAV